MANSILKAANSAALSRFQESGPALAPLEEEIPLQISEWLASLKLMHKVPFRYLVPDERMLPPESIRFFYVDVNWLDVLVDGAYSIGRYASAENSGLVHNKVEGLLGNMVHLNTNQVARDRRTSLFNAIGTGNNQAFEMVTGFLLRSQVVKDFKGVQANAFSSDGTALQLLRLEHLSDEVLLGFFEGETYQLDIHEPSEGLHFGFDTETDSGVDQLCKNLRNMTTGQKLPAVTNAQFQAAQVFRNDAAPVPGNQGGQVVNLYNLSALMFNQLTAATVGYTQPVASVLVNDSQTEVVSNLPQTGMNSLAASDFALQMVEGVGMVSFFNK